MAGPAYCGFLARCRLATSDVSLCIAQGGPAQIGCDAIDLSKVESGVLEFDADAGAACLAALASGSCSGAGPDDVSRLCSPETLLIGTVALGGNCSADGDCAGVDAGPLGFAQIGLGCQASRSSIACAGVCGLGAAVGQPCGHDQVHPGCGPGQGACRARPTPDGGQASTCTPYVGDGGSCVADGTFTQCDPEVAYCADAGNGNAVCQPLVPDGGLCDPAACAQWPDSCPCALVGGARCGPTSAPEVARCQPAAAGVPCDVSLAECGLDGLCQCSGAFPDGGLACTCLLSGPTGPGPDSGSWPPAFGEPCNSTNACASGLRCVTSDAGTAACQGYPDLGESCVRLSCAQFLYCPWPYAGGTTCIPPLEPGAPCVVTPDAFDFPCSVGSCSPVSPGASMGVCIAQAAPGEPCTPGLGSCLGDPLLDSCSNAGVPDGGFLCTPPLCQGGDFTPT